MSTRYDSDEICEVPVLRLAQNERSEMEGRKTVYEDAFVTDISLGYALSNKTSHAE